LQQNRLNQGLKSSEEYTDNMWEEE
jgi:hypothetical protein